MRAPEPTFGAMLRQALLPERGCVAIAGKERVAFLQGLVSNDVAEVAPGHAVWAALLTPQGKWLADFFILTDGERLLLDCERAQAPMLISRLARYKLRAAVEILDVSADFVVHAAWGGAPDGLGAVIMAPDPRLAEAGWRLLAPEAMAANASFEDWDLHRLALGLPDGSRDLEPERTLLLEAGFDELLGVSWSKGCYLGQELTARTRYRGLIKRRLVPVTVAGPLPAPATPVDGNGAARGSMRSGRGQLGLATLRIDALDETLTCGEATLAPRLPAWMRLHP